VIGRKHRVELAPHCPHEDRVGRKRPRGTQRRRCRCEDPLFLVAEQTGLSAMRIQGANREPRLLDAVPLPKTALGDSSRANNPIGGEKRGHVAQGNVGGHENHSETWQLWLPRCLRGEHHGHVDITGQMSQPLGMSGIGESGEMQRMLVRGSSHYGVHLAVEREPHRLFHRMPRDATGATGAASVAAVITAPEAPASDCNPMICRKTGDLILGPHERQFSLDRLIQCGGGDLRPDATGIAEGDGNPGTLLGVLTT
jgi:hypothetical protein